MAAALGIVLNVPLGHVTIDLATLTNHGTLEHDASCMFTMILVPFFCEPFFPRCLTLIPCQNSLEIQLRRRKQQSIQRNALAADHGVNFQVCPLDHRLIRVPYAQVQRARRNRLDTSRHDGRSPELY